MATTPLLTLTPLIQSKEQNLVRIASTQVYRTHHISEDVQLVAGGSHKGIIINKLCAEYAELTDYLPWSFSVWMGGGADLKQEIRSFRFSFAKEVVSPGEQSAIAQRFIKELFVNFPKDYAGFFKVVLKLLHSGFDQLQTIDIDMKFAKGEEKIKKPDASEYRNDAEIEDLNVGHVQDALEHAYPNSLSVPIIAESLRCSEAEVESYLRELEASGIAMRAPNQSDEWLRVDNFSKILHRALIVPESHHQLQSRAKQPTVAIITCLFTEKQSVDAIIENSSTLHKYSKAGDSNVYTIGSIGGHRVVATKLAMIGDSREATTSAGSITTRLLGSFGHVEHVIIVGVGGGVPHYTDAALHIRLGDVVVSDCQPERGCAGGQSLASYVYAHNFMLNRKTGEVDDFATHTWTPKENLLAGIVKKGDEKFAAEWQHNADALITQLNNTVMKGNEYDFAKPPADSDVLTMNIGDGNMVVIPHPNPEHNAPRVHLGPIGAMVTPAQPPTMNAAAPSPFKNPFKAMENNNNGGDNATPSLKNGGSVSETDAGVENNSATASEDAGSSTYNSQLRDRFIERFQLKASDGGFDSVIAAINGSRIDSWVLIRGISDYQQGSSRLGRQWQPYASANAAALVKTILHHVP